MSTAIAAPSAAPEAVPSTYGSASGLRSRPWNVAPATASPVPDDHRREDPRQPQVHDDRLGGRRPRHRHVEPEDALGEDADRRRRREVHATRARSPPRTRRASTTTPATTSHPVAAQPHGHAHGEPPGRAGGDRGGVIGAGQRASRPPRGRGRRRRRRQHEVRVDRQREGPDALGEPRPGRVTMTSSIGRTSPFLTAVRRPSRAARRPARA